MSAALAGNPNSGKTTLFNALTGASVCIALNMMDVAQKRGMTIDVDKLSQLMGLPVYALLVAKLLRSTVIQGPVTPFVMELPPYRVPTFKGLLIHTWERTWQYNRKAGTVILGISIVLWPWSALSRNPDHGNGGCCPWCSIHCWP